MVKFDCVIINPPYDNQTHLRHLEHAIKTSSRYVVSVQPAAWLFSKKGERTIGGKAGESILRTINEHGADIEFIKGASWFDAGLFSEMSVNVIDKGGKGGVRVSGLGYDRPVLLTETYDIKKYGDDPLVESIREKIERWRKTNDLTSTIYDHLLFASNASQGPKEQHDLHPDKNAWYVSIPGVRGHVDQVSGDKKNDFYTIVYRDQKAVRWSPELRYYLKAKTKKRAEGLIRYLKSDLVRFLLFLVKNNLNILRSELKDIPWIDEIDGFDNDKLNEEVGFTEDEKRKIKASIIEPDYYA